MELKQYQKQVIADLNSYLKWLYQTKNYSEAYSRMWLEKGIATGLGKLPYYNDIIKGVPAVCFKVPTGGGKTFLACNAIKPIFDYLPTQKIKAVVWLVPSDQILIQTVKNLKDPNHPYRERLNIDFGGRVEVYTKQELLNGQNFSPISVAEQLSVMVLSYDSFRGRGKDALKAYQENSNLIAFSKVLGKPEQPIPNADESALFQIINQLFPLVIVDESHHARSELSLEMLKNFNPCFVLELTATPKTNSNIISFTSAASLKREKMVKLPVIVYNRDSQSEVIADTIDLRRKLEELASEEYNKTGRYIRPIALLQAQPKGKEDNTTFEKLRSKLIEVGIPENEIAIRTAETNEIKNTNLSSPDCPIRYIITVNALKEGWDCPFAYILASLANKSSKVDVEQILGRILRLPYAQNNNNSALNMSYVLTSSSDFNSTISEIIVGLNNAGFSDNDYRVATPILESEESNQDNNVKDVENPILTPIDTVGQEKPETEFLNFDTKQVTNALERKQAVSIMLENAVETCKTYEKEISINPTDSFLTNLPPEISSKVNSYGIKPQFKEEIDALKLPQFFKVSSKTLFNENGYKFLSKESLALGFTLKGKPYDIKFDDADSEIMELDIRENESAAPKVYKMSLADQRYFKEFFNNLPSEKKVKSCKELIFNQLNKNDLLASKEISYYVGLIIDNMDSSQLSALEKSPFAFSLKIKEKVEELLTGHQKNNFFNMLETEKIVCIPNFVFPTHILPANRISNFGKSLYEAEDDMNNLEQKLVMELTSIESVRWWHRIIVKQGFFINGFINHYPDLLIKTESGKIIAVETKGGHLKNEDTKNKLELGKAWAKASGNQYRYYMVFDDGDNIIEGSESLSVFLELIKNM